MTHPSHKEANKHCPRCREAFHCDEKEGCWCENKELDKETLKKLRQDYIDCLCKNCLKVFETAKK